MENPTGAVARKTQRIEEIKLTKRMLLRNIAKIYDPIGLAAALTILAKIGMQEL